MMRSFILGLTLFFTTCTAISGHYTQTAQNWRGAKINPLLNTLGPPDETIINPNGNTLYIYKTEMMRDFGPKSPAIGVHFDGGRPAITTESGGPAIERNYNIKLFCYKIYEVNKQGRVVNVKSMGGSYCTGR